MPHHTSQQTLETKQSTLAAAIGMTISRFPAWLADSIAIQSSLTKDVKGIDENEQLRLSKDERGSIRLRNSYKRKLAKTAIVEVPRRITSWGVVVLRPIVFVEGGESLTERAALHFRPRILAKEPDLLCDRHHFDAFWALDDVFKGAVAERSQRYTGPGKLRVHQGHSILDAAVVHIVGTAGRTDWQAVGKALATLFDEQFDAATVKMFDRVRNVHAAARRHEATTRACIKHSAG